MKDKIVKLLRKIKYDYTYGLFDLFRRRERSLLTVYEPTSLRHVSFDACRSEDALILISATYPAVEDHPHTLSRLTEGHAISPMAEGAIRTLIASCERECGETILFTSTYRTLAFQSSIYGVNPYAAKPGESEHHSGLVADIKVDGYAQRRFIMSKTGKWMAKHAHEYGFIIRYPLWGEKKTGVDYEPWHLRYVGKPHAEIMYREKLVLESYLERLEQAPFFRFGDTVISAQRGDTLVIPNGVENVCVSQNTRGGYILWFTIPSAE